MLRKKRRQEIVEFILEQIRAEGEIGLKVYKDELIAKACLEFSCGETLIKEVLKHLIITKRIGPFEEDVNDPYSPYYYSSKGLTLPESKTFDIDRLTEGMIPEEREKLIKKNQEAKPKE